MLALVDPADDGYRRTVNTQLTVQESRHRLARKIFHGQRGELRQAYREGQEDRLGALGLVLNAVVLWNTRYIDAPSRRCGRRLPRRRRGRRPAVPARRQAHQHAGQILLHHPASRQRPAAAARPSRRG